jgi:transcription elongation factor Elf1
MADKRRMNDPTQTHFTIKCPACGQQYGILGIMVQDNQVMSCSRCNASFQLHIRDNGIEPYLVSPATGGTFGPAEGESRR